MLLATRRQAMRPLAGRFTSLRIPSARILHRNRAAVGAFTVRSDLTGRRYVGHLNSRRLSPKKNFWFVQLDISEPQRAELLAEGKHVLQGAEDELSGTNEQWTIPLRWESIGPHVTIGTRHSTKERRPAPKGEHFEVVVTDPAQVVSAGYYTSSVYMSPVYRHRREFVVLPVRVERSAQPHQVFECTSGCHITIAQLRASEFMLGDDECSDEDLGTQQQHRRWNVRVYRALLRPK